MQIGRKTALQQLDQRTLSLGVLLSLAVLMSAWLYLDSKRENLISTEIQNEQRLNTLLVEQTARLYDSVDILLRTTVKTLEGGHYLAQQGELALHNVMQSYLTGMPHIRGVSVLDGNGRTLATTFGYPTSGPDFSHRIYFQVLRDNPEQGMYIDVPVQRRNRPDEWLLNIARRLPNTQGGFAGVVVVSLASDYFNSFYQSLELAEGSSVSLLRDDSTLLMRHPAQNESIGKVFGRNPALQPFLSQRLPQVSLRMYSYISGSDVLVNCRFADSHPIYICLSTQEDSLLADWKVDRILIGVVALLIASVIMGLFVMLSRQVRKRELIADRLMKSNKKLALRSRTDYLTGIANRNYIEKKIGKLIVKADRYQRPFSIVLLDIDLFKAVNDNHGHVIGDQVLKDLSAILRDRVRATDMAARWGGEEFLIACDESDIAGATQLAEKLQQAIASYDFGISSQVTASFGVTQYQAGEDSKTLFIRADELLYKAKRAGRNTVITC